MYRGRFTARTVYICSSTKDRVPNATFACFTSTACVNSQPTISASINSLSSPQSLLHMILRRFIVEVWLCNHCFDYSPPPPRTMVHTKQVAAAQPRPATSPPTIHLLPSTPPCVFLLLLLPSSSSPSTRLSKPITCNSRWWYHNNTAIHQVNDQSRVRV